METLGLLAMPIFVLTSGVVGSRLLLLSLRTREIPELAMGLSFVLVGFVGVGLSIAPGFVPGMTPLLGMTLQLLGLLCQAAGFASLATFVWWVFRPKGLPGRIAHLGCLSALLVGVVLRIALASPTADAPNPGHWVMNLVCIAIYSWATAEFTYYAGQLRRRAALGLAKRGMARRLVFWSISTGTVLLVFLERAWVLASTGLLDAGSMAFPAAMGLTSALATWLAFFPPKGVARWLET